MRLNTLTAGELTFEQLEKLSQVDLVCLYSELTHEPIEPDDDSLLESVQSAFKIKFDHRRRKQRHSKRARLHLPPNRTLRVPRPGTKVADLVRLLQVGSTLTEIRRHFGVTTNNARALLVSLNNRNGYGITESESGIYTILEEPRCEPAS